MNIGTQPMIGQFAYYLRLTALLFLCAMGFTIYNSIVESTICAHFVTVYVT